MSVVYKNILNMKKHLLILALLSLVSSAMAQYSQPDRKSGKYTSESSAGDVMTITHIKEFNNLTVEYSLIDPFNKGVLVVFDISGRVIEQQEINFEIDQLIIPVDKWPAGQYTLSLYADKKFILSRKISL